MWLRLRPNRCGPWHGSRGGLGEAPPHLHLSMAFSSENKATPSSVAERYEALIAAGTIEREAAQLALVARLDALAGRLVRRRNGDRGFGLTRLLGLGNGHNGADELRGLYIFGPVGRGKTMLMDLFFESVDLAAKRRA